MDQEYYILIQKLRDFISKYYKNLILKGLIFTASIIITAFLIINSIEYFTWSSILTRTVIFYAFIALAVIAIVLYIIIPFFKLVRIGKTLSFEDAAKIIGVHFADVEDKLLNTIQLHEELNGIEDKESLGLLLAGIEQKAKKLSPIPFVNAVEFRKNLNYLKYVVPPVLVVLLILVIFPSFITEPSSRIVNHSVYFAKPLPYRLNIENNKLEAFQKDDFTLIVKTEGAEIPSDVYINDGKYEYRMAGRPKGIFEYTFKNLNNDVYFKIRTQDYLSNNFHLTVLPKPVIYSFDVLLHYPAYLKKKTDEIENSGDLVVPEGTIISWRIYTKDAQNIIFKIDSAENVLKPDGNNEFRNELTAHNNFWYSLFAENQYIKNQDSLSYSVQVVKDEYPTIELDPVSQDDTEYEYVFFNGSIGDDHGFHSLKLYYRKDSTPALPWESIGLQFDHDITRQLFNYAFKFDDLKIAPGSGMNYYFEVRDNDAVNGFKRSKTGIYDYHISGLEEIKSKYDNISETIKDKLKKTLDELDKINEELQEKREKLYDKKELNWSDKKQLSELLEKQKSLEKQIDELKNLNEELNKLEDLIREKNSDELQEKIDQLNKMFDQMEADNPEDIEKQMDKLDKDKLNEMLQKIEENNNSLKLNLEQNLELYKQLEIQKKIEEAINDLKELAEDQKELADKTGSKKLDKDQAKTEQKKVGEQYHEIEQNIKETDSLNKTLEDPFGMQPDQQKMDSINKELNSANENLNKGRQKKASKNQKQAGQKMEKMASDLSMMMQNAMMAKMGEDAEKIKKMLDNLLDLSFNQEKLMKHVGETSLNDPKYVDNLSDQQLIKEDYLTLHDSLIAISKRQMAVRQFIVRESEKINLYINRALLYLQDRKRGQALNDQQYSMTSMNNLALMLAESLDQMKASMQMSGQKAGQKCPNPGQNPSDMESLIKMQQGLNQGMKEGEKEKGLNGEQGLNQQSEKLARMAEMQSEIRRRLSEYLEKLKKGDGGAGDLSKMVDEMKKSEEDIVNRKITKETLERQKQIEVRLLKSEKAKLEQEKKETRESKEGINRKKELGRNFETLTKEKKNQQEIMQTVPIDMTPYFNDLLKKYLYKLETNGS